MCFIYYLCTDTLLVEIVMLVTGMVVDQIDTHKTASGKTEAMIGMVVPGVVGSMEMEGQHVMKAETTGIGWHLMTGPGVAAHLSTATEVLV